MLGICSATESRPQRSTSSLTTTDVDTILAAIVTDGDLYFLTAQPLSWNQIHWRTSELLDVPPVLLVTECDPLEFRKAMAAFIDGRYVNDALYRGVQSIRRDYELEPFPYVIAFPQHGVEIPFDLRPIVDEATKLVGVLSLPRSIHEPPFVLTQLEPKLAEHVHTSRREQAIELLKTMSRDSSEFILSDVIDRDDRFVHSFLDGQYRHSYRYVTAELSEVERRR